MMAAVVDECFRCGDRAICSRTLIFLDPPPGASLAKSYPPSDYSTAVLLLFLLLYSLYSLLIAYLTMETEDHIGIYLNKLMIILILLPRHHPQLLHSLHPFFPLHYDDSCRYMVHPHPLVQHNTVNILKEHCALENLDLHLLHCVL